MLKALVDTPRVAVLGPVLIEGRDGSMTEPPGALAKALVAVLVGDPGRPAGSAVSVETITDELWGDEPPRNARAALQTLVSRLRAVAAEGLVVSTARGYALAVHDQQTDAGQARLLGREATTRAADDPLTAIAELDRALALWRGEPGADLPYSPVRTQLMDGAAAARNGLLEIRARCLVDGGRPEQAISDLEHLIEGHPFAENLRLTYLRALSTAGRRQEAIAAFAAFRRLLRDEFGSSPSPELVALNTSLLQDDAASASPRDTDVRIGLRAAPNELLGRHHDIEAVQGLLEQYRLVTVLGPGGLGKTRLAQELAARSTSPGVAFVELASVRTDADVTLALASTLGIREVTPGTRLVDAPRPDLRERIIAQLAERPTLLIVDNCEQVIEGAAVWVADLLASLPRLRVLATSRSPLLIGAEHVFSLESLPSVDSDGEPGPAVSLFVERARAARPSVALPADAVARLCTRLDGLPLAIELAAARVRSMSVEQIESRLENRFALLTGGDRSAPERHRTLQAVIEWSWTLLRPAEQRALRRLSLFVDGFSLEAAQRVAGDDASELLDALVTQSLLAVTDNTLTGQPRFRMLETVREFGQVALVDADDEASARSAVHGWADAFCVEAMHHAMGAQQIAMFRSVKVEQDNLVAVLREAIELRDASLVLSVFALLGYHWTVRGAHSEVFAFSAAILDATRDHALDAAHADAAAFSYVMLTGTNFVLGNREGIRAMSRLRRLVRSGVDLEPWLAATARFLLAFPGLPRATDLLHEMSASTDVPTALIGCIIAAQIAENDGDPVTARVAARRAYDLSETSGDTWIRAMSAMSLAQLASQSAHSEEVLVWVDRARAGMLQLDVVQDLQQINWILGGSLLSLGRLDEARALFDDMISNELSIDDGLEMVSVGEFGLAELARIEGRPTDAAEHYARAVASFTTAASKASPWYYMTLSARLASAVVDGDQDAGDVARWAHRLRSRIIALRRARPDYIDKPVLAASILGWSVWAMSHQDVVDRGLELFALAEAMHARQDLPALQLAPYLAEAQRMLGVDRVHEAQDAAAVLSLEERAARAYELISEPVA
ncbi:BTAD domain-containing putative transcriptional regulator [Leifsonia sp. YIM 134122]|uniref:BTAD domain-containing putative transcriptional regulator n=1 Tax=Leifsonia stereocauli TaxID=3134136 RepID=A0ABU9VZV1_9MICO